MLQDEFCECRADLFRTDASRQLKTNGAFKKSFSFQLKKRRVTCKGSRFEDIADSIIYYIIRACFKGGIALREAISA